MLWAPSGFGGLLLSATNTSPLGSTYSQRGWSRFFAKALTVVPGVERGVAPSGHPFAGAILTVGIKVEFGAGSTGFAP